MILPANIVTIVALKDQYLDLKGLAAYSTLGVSTLRAYIRRGKLPAFKVKGKVLIRKSEFDVWLDQYRMKREVKDLDKLADEAVKSLKSNR